MAIFTKTVAQTLTFVVIKKVKLKKVNSRAKCFGTRSNQFHAFNLRQ